LLKKKKGKQMAITETQTTHRVGPTSTTTVAPEDQGKNKGVGISNIWLYTLLFFYATYFLYSTNSLVRANLTKPVFPIKLNDMNYLRTWLPHSIIDYYGVATILCAIIFNSQPFLQACFWSGLILTLGAPGACAWAFYRLVLSASAKAHHHHLHALQLK
jgi:hypothetical protein